MSLQDWKKRYYREDASVASTTELDATRHSLRKWLGLRPKVLDKYGLTIYGCMLTDGVERISISSISCALCVYAKPDWCGLCVRCPIAKITKHSFSSCCYEYAYWLHTDDPKPMIVLLIKTLAYLRKEASL